MKYIFLISAVILSGCATPVPVTYEFPMAPRILLEQCAELKTVPKEVDSPTEILKIVVENYTAHHQCANKVDGWQDWYRDQKKWFDIFQ
jgi:hypothetical protein